MLTIISAPIGNIEHMKDRLQGRGGMPQFQPQPLRRVDIQQEPADFALFERYGSIIFLYVRKHARTREDAEDITSEVFIAAILQDNLQSMPADEQIAWLKRVTRNKIIDHYRKIKQHITVDIDLFVEILCDSEEPEQVLVRNETHQQLRSYIQQLPALQQQLLYLRYAHNLPYAEIAILLNKSETAIYQILTRTRTALRKAYQQQEQRGSREC